MKSSWTPPIITALKIVFTTSIRNGILEECHVAYSLTRNRERDREISKGYCIETHNDAFVKTAWLSAMK